MNLQSLEIHGFKTIDGLHFEPRRLSVLLGPNGAGKSNLISFFQFLSSLVSGNLQVYAGLAGGASRLLFDGPQQTESIRFVLKLITLAGWSEYAVRLDWAAGDAFVFTDEHLWENTQDASRGVHPLTGYRESRISDQEAEAWQGIRNLLQEIVVHHLHDTSFHSRIRQKWPVNDGRRLKTDAANLASFLFRLRNERPPYYRRIRETISLTLPFFDDFVLEPAGGEVILLQWKEKRSDFIFDASQASDGMLRLFALIALLQQPEEDLPKVLILDEPELGLHPHAIQILADLIQAASATVQVMIATQSVSLVDRFEPEDIVVVERRDDRKTTLRRLVASDLQEWLRDYSISELWERNILTGSSS